MSQPQPQTVEYIPHTEPQDHDATNPHEPRLILGHYKVTWSNGFRTASAHLGRPHTISAQPLDPNDPAERDVILEAHRRFFSTIPNDQTQTATIPNTKTQTER